MEFITIKLYSTSKQSSNSDVPETQIPVNATPDFLNSLLGKLLLKKDTSPKKFRFFLENIIVSNSIREVLEKHSLPSEFTLNLTYEPEEEIKQDKIKRCSATMEGHKQSVLCGTYSQINNFVFISGAGDGCVIFWDLHTSTPIMNFEVSKDDWVVGLSSATVPRKPFSEGSKKVKTSGKEDSFSKMEIIAAASISGKVGFFVLEKKPTFHFTHDFKRRITALKLLTPVWNQEGELCLPAIVGCEDGRLLHYSIRATETENNSLALSVGEVLRSINLFKFPIKQLHELFSAQHSEEAAERRTFLLVNGFHSAAYVLDLDAYKVVHEFGHHANTITKVRLCKDREDPNRTTLCISSADFSTSLVKVSYSNGKITSGKVQRFLGHSKKVFDSNYCSRLGRLVSCSEDKTVRIWDVGNAKPLNNLRGHVGSVYFCELSTDEKNIITAGEDSTIKVWDLEKGELLKDLPGHEGRIFVLAIGKDGKTFVSAGEDRKVKVWKK